MQNSSFYIVDSGGTKAEWSFICNGKLVNTFITKGITPQIIGLNEMIEILSTELIPNLTENEKNPDSIFFYGAGCSIKHNIDIVKNALKFAFPKTPNLDVQHDMLGAARSLCLNKKGIAAILGTGSSVAFYDGKWIGKIRAGIGYILGDEGSGAYMGKKLVNLYCFFELNPLLISDLENTFQINRDSVIDNVYKNQFPNKYLASFSKFISKYKEDPQIQSLITESLDAFFVRHILKFEESKTMPLNFIGGVANIFHEELNITAKKYNLQIGEIQRSPMNGLIEYHLKYNN